MSDSLWAAMAAAAAIGFNEFFARAMGCILPMDAPSTPRRHRRTGWTDARYRRYARKLRNKARNRRAHRG